MGQFWGLSGPLKYCESLLQCTPQKINNGIIATAAADSTALNWPVSQ